MEKNIPPDSVISALMNHAKTSDSDFPVHMFPAKMQRIILELNTTCGFPIDYTASAMLAAISVAFGNTHRVEVKRNWQESAIVCIAIVGRDAGGSQCHSLPQSPWFMPIVDELPAWFKNFTRYNTGTEEQFWLSAFNSSTTV